jgi:hypothetical protein
MREVLTMNTDDWPTTEAKFYELFDVELTRERPTGLTGTNFMTDEILGYVRTEFGPAEISTGWFLDHRFFGVTFGRGAGAPSDLERAYGSLDEIHHALYGGGDGEG